MNCTHCGRRISGDAWIEGDVILHKSCIKSYNLSLKGLTHKCPKCKTSGKVNHPTKTETVEVPLGYGETPLCGYDGCRGCHYCHNRVKKAEVPVKETCNLCKGEGFLEKEPTPVTKVVDWKL